MEQTLRTQVNCRNRHLDARRRFGRYKKESEKPARTADVVEDRTLGRLVDAYAKSECQTPYEPYEITETVYDTVIEYAESELLDGIGYTPDDVSKFCGALSQFQHDPDFPNKAGLFLTALAMRGDADSYILPVDHLETIPCLGCMNREKELIVHGSLGVMTAISMEGGNLIVKGDVENHCGFYMKGGRVIIEGNAHYFVGERMKGGEIHVGGEIGSIGDVKAGKIFHKGRLIVDK
jgi:hypothetical protein